MKKLLFACFAALMVVAFAVPAMAADWNFYGSSRMSTFWETNSKEVTGTGHSDGDLYWDLQGNSRIGANVKAGDVGGRFEYGTGINLRLLYGTWNFGGGELLIGQEYTPVNLFYSNQVWGGDNDMLNVGGVYGGRNPAIQVSAAGFKLALVKPAVSAVLGAVDTDTKIPRLEASYDLKLGPASISVCGGYNSFDLVDATNHSESLNSWIVAVGARMDFGPAYIGGDVFTGRNLGNYGMYVAGDQTPSLNARGKIQDNKGMGALAVIGFKVNDMFGLEAGYGYIQGDPDISGLDKDETTAYYVQATINLAKGVFITPELGKFDYKEDINNNDQGDFTYFGAKWQINF